MSQDGYLHRIQLYCYKPTIILIAKINVSWLNKTRDKLNTNKYNNQINTLVNGLKSIHTFVYMSKSITSSKPTAV